MEEQFSAGGVVMRVKNGSVEVLLIKDRFGHWTWPKGHIDPGETPPDAAIREINEETGLTSLDVVEEIGVQGYCFNAGNRDIQKRVHIFLVEARGEETIVVQRSEIEKAKWFPYKAAVGKIEYKGSRVILEKGIRIFREKHKI